MSVESIYLSHLPRGISANELTNQLVQKCSKVFEKAQNTGDLIVQVFNKAEKTTATVGGFSYQYERLELLLRIIKIEHNGESMTVNVKPDTGEQRNSEGQFLVNRSAIFRRDLAMLAGGSHRKLLQVFKRSFRESVGWNVFNGHSTSGFLNTAQINENVAREPGGVEFITKLKAQNSTIIRFYSHLEFLQGLVYLNNNPRLSTGSLALFTSKNKQYIAHCREVKGLGKEGEVVKIYDLSMELGYVPFGVLNMEYIDTGIKEKFDSRCWLCKSSYKIVGINLNLSSYAGKCKCTYAATVYPRDSRETSGYHWPDEKFTRLILGESEEKTLGNRISLLISHFPIKTKYESVEEYVSIIMPLLEEEWCCTSLDFKVQNSTTGTLRVSKTVEMENGRTTYAWKLAIPKSSKAWLPGNPKAIKKATFMWGQKNTRVVGGSHVFNNMAKAKLFRISEYEPSPDTHVAAYFQVILPHNVSCPNPQTTINIDPKPDKSEYAGMRHALNKWLKTPKDERPILKDLLLDPMKNAQEGWRLLTGAITVNRKSSLRAHRMISYIRDSLNEEQKQALQKAKDNAVSIICGPPGTGKTVTLASIVVELSIEEDGGILVCSPSNKASDEIASAIHTISRTYSLNIKCIRIFAKSKEAAIRSDVKLSNTPQETEDKSYDVLHKEVRKHADWLGNNDLAENIMKFDSGMGFLLTSEEIRNVKEHEKRIEKLVMKNYNIFISTVGALGDHRVESWISKDFSIPTVVLDEAGQLIHPAMINLFNVHPKRLIVGGDHLQLPPSVNSYAAQTAGLNKSLMEISSWTLATLSSSCNYSLETLLLPWTTLAVQHRMHPEIRTVVSAMTYDNALRDSQCVIARILSPRLEFLLAKFENRRIAFLDHACPESKDGLSYSNAGEASMIVRSVREMLNNGVLSTDIVVLTYYEAQRQKIEAEIGMMGIEIRNVDAFQGGEKNVVILSLVRSNTRRAMGFVANQNRLNVAISRAKEFLILACNKDFFTPMTLQHWSTLICQLKKVAYTTPKS